jgi:predicted nucleotidyltransferase
MPSLSDIQTLADKIARDFHPDKIILFGSHARGTAGSDSDVDLLVIMPRDGETKHEQAAAIYSKCHPGFPFDVLVRTQEEFEARLKLRDWFMRDIAREGKVLHAK